LNIGSIRPMLLARERGSEVTFRRFFALAVVLSACPEKDNKPPLPPRDGPLGARRCSAEPGRKNPQRPVFQRPFDGDFPVYSLFDHQTPGDYKPFEPGSTELSYCGIEMLGLPDGVEGYAWGLPAGTPVFAVADGVVEHAGNDPEFFCVLPEFRRTVDNQLSVRIKHQPIPKLTLTTHYQHLEKVLVKEGDEVRAGQKIGLSGKSGCAREPLLGFRVMRLVDTKTRKPTPIDPYGWDGPRADPWAEHPNGTQSYYLWKEGEAPQLGGRVK